MTGMTAPEARLEALFRQHVRAMGGMTDKIAPVRKGLPDRMVLLPGGVIRLVELKAPGGRLSDAQVVFHQRAAQLGSPVDVIGSVEELLAWADKHRPDPRKHRLVYRREPATV